MRSDLPFAGYKDFDACVKANSSKGNAKAYCATIMRAVEKAEQDDVELIEKQAKIGKRLVIVKIDEDKRQVFGWVSVAKDANGETIEDLQGDVIEMDELEPAVYDFVLKSRVGTDLHTPGARGQLIESLVITPEKLDAMGLVSKGAPVGAWWGGWQFDAEAFALVKSGDRTMFSIKGSAKRVEV